MQYLLTEEEYKQLREAEYSNGEAARAQMVDALVKAGALRCWHDDETMYKCCGKCPINGSSNDRVSRNLCPRQHAYSK